MHCLANFVYKLRLNQEVNKLVHIFTLCLKNMNSKITEVKYFN